MINKDNLYTIANNNGWQEYLLENMDSIPEVPGIYIFVNTINYKAYIGQSNNLRKRTKEHFSPAHFKNRVVFDQAIIKYGRINFKFFVIKTCEKELLDQEEINCIEYYKTYGQYNMTKGGKGRIGDELSEVQKSRIGEINTKETWGYNFITKKFLKASSRNAMADVINNLGDYNINVQNIYDCIKDVSYSKEFLFADSKEELEEKIKNFTIPEKPRQVYLYNYKTKEYFGPVTTTEGTNIIRNYCKVDKEHLATAVNNKNFRVKDFIIGSTLEELEENKKKLDTRNYFYHIESKATFVFENTNVAIKELEQLGYKKLCYVSIRKVLEGKQETATGFIVAFSKQELVKKIFKYYKNSVDNVIEDIKDLKLENDPEIINIMDELNESSIEF